MSRYKVETGSLYTLARAMDIGADAVDQAMRQSVAPACRRIVYQRGAQVWADAQRLADALRNMNALKSDIRLLASALRIVAETASQSDKAVYALFQGLPVCAVMGRKIIEYDYTDYFIHSGNQRQRELTIGWGGDLIGNFRGLFGQKFGDTTDEAMIKQSLTELLDEMDTTVQKKRADVVNKVEDIVLNEPFGYAYKAIMTEIGIGKEITQGWLDNLADEMKKMGKSDDRVLEWLKNKDTLEWLNSVSEKLARYGEAKDIEQRLSKILEIFFADYSARIESLEAIRAAMCGSTYDNEIVVRCIDEMLEEYRCKAEAMMKELIDYIVAEGFDAVLKITRSPLKQFLSAKDDIDKLAGAQDVADALRRIYGSANYSYALVSRYDEYAARIRSGNYTQEDVDACNQYFELARQARIKECEAIKDYQNTLLKKKLLVSKEEADSARGLTAQIDEEIERLRSLDGSEYTANQSFNAGFSAGGGGGR